MLRDSEYEPWLCLQRSEQFASFTEGQGLIKGLLSWSLSTPPGVGMTSSSTIIDSYEAPVGREKGCGHVEFLLARAGELSACDWLHTGLIITIFFN